MGLQVLLEKLENVERMIRNVIERLSRGENSSLLKELGSLKGILEGILEEIKRYIRMEQIEELENP